MYVIQATEVSDPFTTSTFQPFCILGELVVEDGDRIGGLPTRTHPCLGVLQPRRR
jgi:hypothetical protein